MSSTRNKNTIMNYNAEEKKNDRISNYKFNINKSKFNAFKSAKKLSKFEKNYIKKELKMFLNW